MSVVDDLHLEGRPLLVTSPTPRKLAAEPIAADFEERGIEPAIVTVEEASFEAVESVIDAAEEVDASYLIGVGGGKAIDIAKMATDHLDTGFLSVPTAASHDGIVSNRGSVPDGNTRHSVAAEPPLAVVADTGILANAPWELTTAGCADIISNYTAVMDWRLPPTQERRVLRVRGRPRGDDRRNSRRQRRHDPPRPRGVRLDRHQGAHVLGGGDVHREFLPAASGAEHLFSHQLDRLAPGAALHGHQVGVGSIMTAYLHEGESGIWTEIRDALASIDAPTTAADLGIDDETVIEALTTCHAIRDRYTILGDGMDERAAREVAVKTGVIG
ncbi:iron-containing alcohol dehydrogenase [Saliphagus sp. GCM10025308]